MGFLDAFDDPNFMMSVLGLSGGNSGAGGATAAVPPPASPQMAPPLPPAQDVGYAPGNAPQVPLPTPDPRLANAAPPDQTGQPLNIAPPFPTPPAQPPGPPLSLAPPGVNPNAPPVPTPTTAPGVQPGKFNGIASALGIPQAMGMSPDDWRARMAGLGKGLTAVGQLRPGATPGAAIAAGAGGALQGTAAAQEQQKTQLFNQSSQAFKDMLAARNSDNTEAYRQAQGEYLKARAQSLMTGGTANGTRAWQNTDYGKTIQVENQVQKYEKGQQILLQKRWGMNGATPEQQQQDLDNLKQSSDSYRQRLYKQIGVDPNKGSKLMDMGTSQDNPFDTKGMNLEQFNQMVPMGGWFKDQNGDIRQRTVPPPTPGGNAAPGQQGAAPNYDDMTAMQNAA